MISESTLDKVGAMGAAFSLIDLVRGFNHGGVHVGGSTGGIGFLTSLLNVLVRVWEEKGGSMKDESEMLESMFADPQAKNEKLTPQERSKIAAVIKAMTPTEQKVFRIAIFVMNPDVATIEVPEKKDKDGKVISPAGKRTEKTGVDPRVNVLHGIAEHVHDNLDNVDEVAEMLRGTGALGGNNEALKFLIRVQTELKKLLCAYFEVQSIELITFEMVKSKAKEISDKIIVPDQTLPRPPASLLVRLGRMITPGARADRSRPKVTNAQRETAPMRSRVQRTTAICLAILIAMALIFSALKMHEKETGVSNIINTYQPTTTSAEQPMK